METTAQMVRSARRRSSLTARDLAALAGVSPSLVSRAEAGKVTPSADAYRSLLRAAGFMDAGGSLAPLSRPSALWAARWLLGDLDAAPPQFDEWVATWLRAGLVASDGVNVPDADSLAFRAGRMAVLSARPEAVPVATPMLAQQIANRLASEGIEYALSGDEALMRYGSAIVPSWPVLYVTSVQSAVDALGVRPVLPSERGPRALLIPFDGRSEAGRSDEFDGLWFVGRLQAALDGYAGDGRMVEQAQVVMDGWRRA